MKTIKASLINMIVELMNDIDNGEIPQMKVLSLSTNHNTDSSIFCQLIDTETTKELYKPEELSNGLYWTAEKAERELETNPLIAEDIHIYQFVFTNNKEADFHKYDIAFKENFLGTGKCVAIPVGFYDVLNTSNDIANRKGEDDFQQTNNNEYAINTVVNSKGFAENVHTVFAYQKHGNDMLYIKTKEAESFKMIKKYNVDYFDSSVALFSGVYINGLVKSLGTVNMFYYVQINFLMLNLKHLGLNNMKNLYLGLSVARKFWTSLQEKLVHEFMNEYNIDTSKPIYKSKNVTVWQNIFVCELSRRNYGKNFFTHRFTATAPNKMAENNIYSSISLASNYPESFAYYPDYVVKCNEYTFVFIIQFQNKYDETPVLSIRNSDYGNFVVHYQDVSSKIILYDFDGKQTDFDKDKFNKELAKAQHRFRTMRKLAK